MRHHVEAWRPDDDQRVTLSGGPVRVDITDPDPAVAPRPAGFACAIAEVKESRAEEPTTELLTEAEHQAVALAGELWNLLCQIVGDGPTRDADLIEFRVPIHVIQRAVMKQAAARAYPDLYRLLGETLEEPTS